MNSLPDYCECWAKGGPYCPACLAAAKGGPVLVAAAPERAPFELGPGQRLVTGRRMYSAAWLGDA